MPKSKRTPSKVAVNVAGSGSRWPVLGICLALAVITFVVFGQTLRHAFIDFDDDEYVYANPVVSQGLTCQGMVWAFSQTDASNWHPLTWLSHMLDCQLYGLRPAGHHLTNILLHAATAIALFLILREMTAAFWRSALVAAVFAIHPLRTESVAWVAERKDVLSGLFFCLAIGAYARYARFPRSIPRYGLVMLLFAAGLMCKPMLVTLPLIFLLLDYWPLQRRESVRKLVIEKLPLLALSAGACMVAILAQSKAIQSMISIPLALRLSNALMACVIYVRQMVWPSRLAMYYPYPRTGLPGWEICLAAAFLAGLTVMAWRERRARPWLLVGWLWYLVMLLPVLGIIQAGAQAHADRYTYLPQIGIYVALTWLVAEWCARRQASRAVMAVCMTALLTALMFCAWKQTAYWQNSETLWTHTLNCTTGNYVAHNALGNAFSQAGKLDEAISEYRNAVQIKPDYGEAHANLGNILDQTGNAAEAKTQFEDALKADPSNPAFQNNLAWLLASCPEASLRNGPMAVELAQQANVTTGGRNLIVLRTLAAAYAETKQWDEARQTAQKGLDLAHGSGREDLAQELSRELERYRAGLPVYR